MEHPRPWFRYVDADDLQSSTAGLSVSGLRVQSVSGDNLGNLDGFIVDAATGRPYYLTVDAGGWFKSKLFLLPIGHVGFDRDQKRFLTDLSRDRVHNFPGFDRDEFEKLPDDELNRMDEQIVAACCPMQAVDRSNPAARFRQWTHYQSPGWWDAEFSRPDRVDKAMKDMGAPMQDISGMRH